MWQICKTYYPSVDSEGYCFIMNSVDFFPLNGLRNRGSFNSNVANVILIIPIKWCSSKIFVFLLILELSASTHPSCIPWRCRSMFLLLHLRAPSSHLHSSIVQERPSARSGSRRIVSECPGHRGMIGIWSWWTLRDGIRKFKNMMAILTFAQLFFWKRLVRLAYPAGTACGVLFSVRFYGSWLQYDLEKINTQYITTSAHQNQNLGPWNGLHHHHHHHHHRHHHHHQR